MKNGAAIRTGTNQNIIDLGTEQNKFKNHKNKVYKIHKKEKYRKNSFTFDRT